jgi:Domain of unknown function (DUF222)
VRDPARPLDADSTTPAPDGCARRAGTGGRDGEHVAGELAAVLILTGRSADMLLELSRRLQRLPQTTALLASGIIDRSRAAVIADQLSLRSAGRDAEGGRGLELLAGLATQWGWRRSGGRNADAGRGMLQAKADYAPLIAFARS